MGFNFGPEKILVVLVFALIFLGPDKLPEAARKIGEWVGHVRRLSGGFQQELRQALDEPLQAFQRELMAGEREPLGSGAEPAGARAENPLGEARLPAAAPAGTAETGEVVGPTAVEVVGPTAVGEPPQRLDQAGSDGEPSPDGRSEEAPPPAPHSPSLPAWVFPGRAAEGPGFH